MNAVNQKIEHPRPEEASESFPPICAPDAGILVLGSMPGVQSLQAQQYYAHPRNAFWPILMQVLGVVTDYGAPLPSYEARVQHMRQHRIAVWDVLQYCERPGSLDASIRRDTMVLNDFGAFLQQHPRIRRICFNGATAATLFERHATPLLQGLNLLPAERLRLPSTSPAHAGMTRQDKLSAWRDALTQE